MSNTTTVAGQNTNGNGTITVGDGFGSSSWTNSSDITIASAGTATLNISGGGSVSNAAAYFGLYSGSHGTAVVGGGTGNSTWTSSGRLYVGQDGAGTMTISGGGSVSNTYCYIAYHPGSTGTVTVGDGTGISTWTNSDELDVGIAGTGTLNINTGGHVTATVLAGGNSTSSVNFNGGTISITKTSSSSNTINLLANGGTIDVPTAGTTMTVSGLIGGAGGLTKSGQATLKLTHADTYAGNTTISAGTLAIGAHGSFASSPKIFIAGGAKLDVSAVTGGANYDGAHFALANAQSISGNGTIVGALDNSSGTISPGFSPGSLTIQGNYAQSAVGNLEIEIGGTTPGANGYDLLSVTGTASLGGKLTVNGVGGNSFMPSVGQTFDILTATSGVSGMFANNSGGWVAGGSLVHYSTTYSANKVTLQITSIDALTPGDFNGDGFVDLTDYAVWCGSFGSQLSAADGNRNGVIDAGDYTIWRDHLEAGTPPGTPSDYNGNGVVDAADYTVWRDHLGQNYALANRDPSVSGPIDAGDYAYWVAHFGQSGSGAGSTGGSQWHTQLCAGAGCFSARAVRHSWMRRFESDAARKPAARIALLTSWQWHQTHF